MNKNNIKDIIRYSIPGLVALFLIDCSGYTTIIEMREVNAVSDGQNERIIKLSNPLGIPDRTLAGVVFIKKGASVCTDYPREEIIKSIDDLTMTEKHLYCYFTNYEIKTELETLGYVSIPVDYRAILWKSEKDKNCKYKVQIISINKDHHDISDVETKSESGGGHGN